MPVELILGLVAVIAIRIIAGMKIPAISPLLRGMWNLSCAITSLIPFFGWASRFIIADTAKEKKEKEDLIDIGDTMDGMVNAPWSSGYTPKSGSGFIQSGDMVRDSDGNSYRARREGHLVYLTRRDGTEVVVDTDMAEIDGKDSFDYSGIHFVK